MGDPMNNVSLPPTALAGWASGMGGGWGWWRRFGGVFGFPCIGEELIEFAAGGLGHFGQDASQVGLRIDAVALG